MAKILTISKIEAQNFLYEQETLGDHYALKHLKNVFATWYNGSPAIRIVRAALELNDYIELMELDEVPYNEDIDSAYRLLMMKLIDDIKICAEK